MSTVSVFLVLLYNVYFDVSEYILCYVLLKPSYYAASDSFRLCFFRCVIIYKLILCAVFCFPSTCQQILCIVKGMIVQCEMLPNKS